MLATISIDCKNISRQAPFPKSKNLFKFIGIILQMLKKKLRSKRKNLSKMKKNLKREYKS
jgi:hypothetical protein